MEGDGAGDVTGSSPFPYPRGGRAQGHEGERLLGPNRKISIRGESFPLDPQTDRKWEWGRRAWEPRGEKREKKPTYPDQQRLDEGEGGRKGRETARVKTSRFPQEPGSGPSASGNTGSRQSMISSSSLTHRPQKPNHVSSFFPFRRSHLAEEIKIVKVQLTIQHIAYDSTHRTSNPAKHSDTIRDDKRAQTARLGSATIPIISTSPLPPNRVQKQLLRE